MEVQIVYYHCLNSHFYQLLIEKINHGKEIYSNRKMDIVEDMKFNLFM